jgi:putative tryptophan/tyrosine transport system substrate-binding protein
MPKTIGFLGACNETMWGGWKKAFEDRLTANGWTIGDDVLIECKWAQGLEKNYIRWAKYFVKKKVDVIVTGGTQCTMACKDAAGEAKPPVPVVFATAGDPIDTKLVTSFSSPGNLTGVSNQQSNLVVKRLDMLRQFSGQPNVVGLVGNDKSPNVKLEMKIAEQVAPTFGLKVRKGPIRKPQDIARVIGGLKGKVKGLLVCTDPLITTYAVQLNTAANKAAIPTVHAFKEYVLNGGTISYGPKFDELFQNAADLVTAILRGNAGANMANSPVRQPDNFECCRRTDPIIPVPASLAAISTRV